MDRYPTEILRGIVASNPGADEAAHFTAFRAALSEDELNRVCRDWFSQRYRQTLRSMRPREESDAERKQREAEREAATREAKSLIQRAVEKRADELIKARGLVPGKKRGGK